MFLTKNNHIKWKFLGVMTVIATLVILAGIFWFDKPVYIFLRGFEWSGFEVIGKISYYKVWLIGSFVIAMIILLKNIVKTKSKESKHKNRFSLHKIFNKFIEYSKSNKVLFVFYSIVLASLVTGILKYVLGRQRPVFFEALDQTGFYPFTNEWAFNSMPSGHATASFAGLIMIGLLFPRIKWFTWTVVIIIGISRICVGLHWPSDIIFGAFIAMVSADMIKSALLAKK